MEEVQYTDDFYEVQMPISLRSARLILPKIISLIQPKSILDVGCGTGVWLSVALESGISNILGIDGDYVNKNKLSIPQDKFIDKDLKLPFQLNQTYDLVISSEVAEHLPFETSEQFVKTLINHSSAVLFSAAAPGQGGTYHINEQPQQFWVDLFLKNNYLPIDLLRADIWNAKGVDWWYKQNMILYVRKDIVESNEALNALYKKHQKDNYNRTHPEMVFHMKGIKSAFGRFMQAPIYTIGKLIRYSLT